MTVQVGDRIEGINNQYEQDYTFISGVVTEVSEDGDVSIIPDSYENPYAWTKEGTWMVCSWNYKVVGPATSSKEYLELFL